MSLVIDIRTAAQRHEAERSQRQECACYAGTLAVSITLLVVGILGLKLSGFHLPPAASYAFIGVASIPVGLLVYSCCYGVIMTCRNANTIVFNLPLEDRYHRNADRGLQDTPPGSRSLYTVFREKLRENADDWNVTVYEVLQEATTEAIGCETCVKIGGTRLYNGRVDALSTRNALCYPLTIKQSIDCDVPLETMQADWDFQAVVAGFQARLEEGLQVERSLPELVDLLIIEQIQVLEADFTTAEEMQALSEAVAQELLTQCEIEEADLIFEENLRLSFAPGAPRNDLMSYDESIRTQPLTLARELAAGSELSCLEVVGRLILDRYLSPYMENWRGESSSSYSDHILARSFTFQDSWDRSGSCVLGAILDRPEAGEEEETLSDNRALVAIYLREHREELKSLFFIETEDDLEEVSEETIQSLINERIEDIEYDGWFGHIEILIMSRILQRPIYVYTGNSFQFDADGRALPNVAFGTDENGDPLTSEPIYLRGGAHYLRLIPKESAE